MAASKVVYQYSDSSEDDEYEIQRENHKTPQGGGHKQEGISLYVQRHNILIMAIIYIYRLVKSGTI